MIWKKLVITRIYDKTNNTLLYLAHATQVQDGSAKTSLSTVPLYKGDVTGEGQAGIVRLPRSFICDGN